MKIKNENHNIIIFEIISLFKTQFIHKSRL